MRTHGRTTRRSERRQPASRARQALVLALAPPETADVRLEGERARIGKPHAAAGFHEATLVEMRGERMPDVATKVEVLEAAGRRSTPHRDSNTCAVRAATPPKAGGSTAPHSDIA
jgi:hypothetical protein